MNIIRPGDLSRLNRSHRFDCEACGCAWVASSTEYLQASDCRNGTCYKMKCPTCGRETVLYPEDEKHGQE